MLKIAINGFGRIGKTFLRVIQDDLDAVELLDVAVINMGNGDPAYAAYSFAYDTVMGRYDGHVEQQGDQLIVGNKSIRLIETLDPLQAAWGEYDIDWVVDCTGAFTHRQGAEKHLQAGAGNVLISAPVQDDIVTIVPGVNDDAYNPAEHTIVSLASCTTNALAVVLKVLHDAYTVKQAFVTSIHAYTNSQRLLDVDPREKRPRRSRAAALNIVPTTTGAAAALKRILPDIADSITAVAVRVPVANISFLEVAATLETPATAQAINELFEGQSYAGLMHILDVTDEPLVSSDFIGSGFSVVIDSQLTQAYGSQVKVHGWYDNEWSYCSRLKDFLLAVSP